MAYHAVMVERFGASSRWTHLGGPVHYVDFGGSGRPIVLVHGLGGSHANWLAVGADLARHGRVFAPDLSGFGRTPPRRGGATVAANRDLLDAFLEAIAGEPAVLVGNSMGGALGILEAAAAPDRVAGLVLVAPALPLAGVTDLDTAVASHFAAYAVPGLGEAYVRRRLRRLGPEGIVEETLRLCCVDPGRIPQDVVAAGVAIRRERMDMPWADRSFLMASRSLMRTLLQRRRFDDAIRAIAAPTLIVQGEQDRLVPLANVLRVGALRPDWRVEVMPDVGHVPQLEAPERFVAVVTDWLDAFPAGTPAES